MPDSERERAKFLMQGVRLVGIILLISAWGSALADPGVPPNVPGMIDVTKPPYSAKGDGITDDTAAFEAALHAAGEGSGGTVFVPRGMYLISGSLRFRPNVTLQGIWEAPPTAYQFWSPGDEKKAIPGSVLLATGGEGRTDGPPFMAIHVNCTVKGLTIFYPNQVRANPPKPYPYTIYYCRHRRRGGQLFDHRRPHDQSVSGGRFRHVSRRAAFYPGPLRLPAVPRTLC